MAATIKLTSPVGEIEFSDAPLISRRLDWNRGGLEQGSSIQKVNCELVGFFTGNNNAEITTKVDALLAIIASNDATLYYHDGSRVVINNKVWFAAHAEPVEWKEYVANYSLAMYYFQEPMNQNLVVSWSTTAGSYQFIIAPNIARAWKPNRKSPRSSYLTPSGISMGDAVTVTLEGQLFAATPQLLDEQREALISAFSKDGTLNYGGFYSADMRILSKNIPTVFPMTWMNFSIDMMYDTGPGISEFTLKREFSRVHSNPLIRDNLYCAIPPTVTQRNTSGQYITYSFRAAGYDISTLRTFLANEALQVVDPTGTELDGGKEIWDEYGDEPAVSLSFTKFHPVPLVGNLTNT